jgi:hypothetical protein
MNSSLFTKPLAAIVLSGCVISFALNAQAAPGPTPPATELLRQAYATLAVADHDYKGHRVAAMKQIEAAEKELGVKVKGDGKGHEPQGVSDTQLRTALGLLQQARTELKGKPLTHVDNAIKQITTALTIK